MTDKGEGQSSSHHSHGHHQHHGGNFDHAADDYDERAQTLFVFHKAVVQELQERLQSSKTTVAAIERPTLFEFGCGTGNVCLPLAVHCQHVYGVDVSANMLAKAQAKIHSQSIGNATLQQMEMTDIQQLASHQMPTTYDWVVCCMVLHHLTQPMETLKILTQLLSASNGTLVIVEFGATTDGNHHHHSHEHHHHHHHHHQDHNSKADDGDSAPKRTQEILDQYGIFSHGFDVIKLQQALQDLGLSKFDTVELPPLEGMDKDHPFFGLPIIMLFASK